MDAATATRAWPLAEESGPVRLMATIWADGSGVHDDLSSAEGFGTWLEAVSPGAGSASVGAADLAAARNLRDAMRRLAAYRTGDTRAAASSPMTDVSTAVAVLNDAATRLPAPALKIEEGSFSSDHSPTDAIPASMATLAAEAIELFGGPDADNLRACQAPGCVLYFVKSHPRREWCSVACGNRARAARHYERNRSHAAPANSAG